MTPWFFGSPERLFITLKAVCLFLDKCFPFTVCVTELHVCRQYRHGLHMRIVLVCVVIYNVMNHSQVKMHLTISRSIIFKELWELRTRTRTRRWSWTRSRTWIWSKPSGGAGPWFVLRKSNNCQVGPYGAKWAHVKASESHMPQDHFGTLLTLPPQKTCKK